MIKSTYACTPYNPNFVESSNGKNLDLMISPSLVLETFLCQIRGIIIIFSKRKAKEKNLEENQLLVEINLLEKERNENNKTLLDALKSRLERIREYILKGIQIRSRAIMTREGEKPSKYFLSLKKQNTVSKNIPELNIDDNSSIIDPKEILNAQKLFYQRAATT